MIRLMLIAIVVMIAPTLTPAEKTPVAPNGIALYPEYMTSQVIASSYRGDKTDW
ncbi:MAG: hypothetical protein PHH91_04970 [Desulfuromonadaceae bacterium]|nr:hypothetical protein [Desulfuromonadaceae bacterium]